MVNTINRNTIGNNILTTAEAAEILGLTKMSITNLVRDGKLTPVKKDKQGMIFLRADIIDYKNRSKNINREGLYYDQQSTTDISIKFYEDHINKITGLRAVNIYLNAFDAVLDDFYIPGDIFLWGNSIREIETPNMVIMGWDNQEIWLNGCNCGYGGTGPHGALGILLDLKKRGLINIELSDKELGDIIFNNKVVSIYPDHASGKASIIGRASAINENAIDKNKGFYGCSLYLAEDKPILVQNLREHSEPELLNVYKAFVPNPEEILIYYDHVTAMLDGYCIQGENLNHQKGVYQFIIKDASGRELWLSPTLSKIIPPEYQPDIQDIFKSCGFKISPDMPLNVIKWITKGLTYIKDKDGQPARFIKKSE